MVDAQLTVLLQHERQHLLDLKHRWTNAFVSEVRFDWHVQNAVEVANELTGKAIPLRVACMSVWMGQDSAQDEAVSISSDTAVSEVSAEDSAESVPPADGLLLADALEHESAIPEDSDGNSSKSEPSVRFVWCLPVGPIQM